MKRICSLLLTLLCSVSLAQAEALTRDLGRNLVYYRIHILPADLPAPDSKRQEPCIIDVRYVHGDPAAAAALQAWIKFHATARTPVFILANVATDSVLLTPLQSRGMAGILVIGSPAPEFTPDLPILISSSDERRAYDALETGTDITLLLTENGNKARNDEASLSKERVTDLPGDTVVEDSPKNSSPPIPVDAVLQRAVHLHRTLVALKKI